MSKKTEMNVVSIFDGKQDATDVFVALITERVRKDARDFLAGEGPVCYNESKVQVTSNRASGLCG